MSNRFMLLTRRALLKTAAISAAGLLVPQSFFPACADNDPNGDQIPPTEAETVKLDKIARAFITRFKSPGLSVAIARQNRFFRQAWGLAAPNEKLTTSHLFRIASVTKPLTAVAIFQLIGKGDLKLEDKVFGPDSILGYDFGRNYPAVVNEITIHHLLTHTCGGWSNESKDPMFEYPAWGYQKLIAYTLQHWPLKYSPGKHYAYSNFGYCILGRVIETLSKQSYERYVQDKVLSPCGITDMQIAGNTLAARRPNEVMYFAQDGEDAYNMNLSRMDSHGGWLGTPNDLVNFSQHVDAFEQTPGLLSPTSLKNMTTPTEANDDYACGWNVLEGLPYWWHDGSLPGTETLLVHASSGWCWAAFANTRTKDTGLALQDMMNQMADAIPSWLD